MSENNSLQLDAACRILTISSSLAGAKAFINRLKALSIEGQSPASDGKLNDKTSEENIIPWTIVNRYYTADVHFAAHVIHGMSPMVFDKPHIPPAVIYVWVDGEPYVKHVEELSRMMSGYEPEVSLAVRIPKSHETTGLVEDNSERESNTDIDTILMSYGFEYIDTTGEVPLRRTVDAGDEFRSTEDIPHLPRVLDALSTIMWPSMKSGHKGSVDGEFDNKSKRERDSILEELLSHGHGTMPSSANRRDGEEEEDEGTGQVQALPRSEARKSKGRSDLPRLGESDDLKVTSTDGSFTSNTLPWLTPNSGQNGGIFLPIDGVLLSPVDTEATSPFGMKEDEAAKSMTTFSIGFEDDFTVFVSAPAATPDDVVGYHKQQDGFGSPIRSAGANSTLEPESASVRYHSLGSVSDFEGSDFEDQEPRYESLDDGDNVLLDCDDDLPTKEEIRETSAKIFGTTKGEEEIRATVAGGSETESHGDDIVPGIDLSQVMSTLEQIKMDIAEMDDEEERRKAAARVTLGLLYGLDG